MEVSQQIHVLFAMKNVVNVLMEENLIAQNALKNMLWTQLHKNVLKYALTEHIAIRIKDYVYLVLQNVNFANTPHKHALHAHPRYYYLKSVVMLLAQLHIMQIIYLYHAHYVILIA